MPKTHGDGAVQIGKVIHVNPAGLLGRQVIWVFDTLNWFSPLGRLGKQDRFGLLMQNKSVNVLGNAGKLVS
jgi:hypothetical protein